ncbi:MAG: branched-chain amino acid transporter permease [Anaerotignum sp.]|nr:branched-chain amino acid transporter permease [Anaerotignum sp.]
MTLSIMQSILIIAICAGCTFLERAFPFLVFRGNELPDVIKYLGKALPMAIMATLVVYCLKDTTFTAPSAFAPQLMAAAITALLHIWRRNTMLSIFGGTIVYMLLVQAVF